MSFSRVRSSGLWVPNSTIEPHEWEKFDQNLSRALDGHGGGAYAPTSPLDIGGAGIRVLTPGHADAVTPKAYVDAGDSALSSSISSLTGVVAGKVGIGYAQYALSVAGGSNGTQVNLSERFASPGFVLASHEITLPAVGTYLYIVRGTMELSNTGHLRAGVSVRRGADSPPTGQFTIRSRVWMETASQEMEFSGGDMMQLDDVAKKITVAVSLAGGGTATIIGTAHLNILRLF